MAQTIKLGDKEYDFESLSDEGKHQLELFQFVSTRIIELNNMKALLVRARNSYLDSLKQEVLADKAGILFGQD